MSWWAIELITTVILVAVLVVLGPLIKRFGRAYAGDIFRGNPRTGKSYLVLMDVAYYLIFTAYVLFTVTLSQPPEWGPNARDALGDQLQHEVSRIGGMLLLMGVLHGLNVLSLPLVGRLLGLSRQLDEDTPAHGWFFFTPLAIVGVAGLLRGFARGERWLAATLGAAALAHWAFVGSLAAAQASGPWGPRPMATALPLMLLFLPEGFDAMGGAGTALAALSLVVQILGAFGDSQRWERLYGPLPNASVVWDFARSPLALQLNERVLRPAVPASGAGKLSIREYPLVVLGPRGSRITFSGDGPVVKGSDETCRDVHLQGGARVLDGHLRLAADGDALFLRATPSARSRPLELRLLGRGRGTLRVGEATFWSESRVKSYAIAGGFRLRHAYDYPESGGPDLTVSVVGEASLESASLVPAGAPDDPIELPEP